MRGSGAGRGIRWARQGNGDRLVVLVCRVVYDRDGNVLGRDAGVEGKRPIGQRIVDPAPGRRATGDSVVHGDRLARGSGERYLKVGRRDILKPARAGQAEGYRGRVVVIGDSGCNLLGARLRAIGDA